MVLLTVCRVSFLRKLCSFGAVLLVAVTVGCQRPGENDSDVMVPLYGGHIIGVAWLRDDSLYLLRSLSWES